MIRRVYALVVLGVGVLMLVAAALKVLPGGFGPGGALAFLGLMLVGLSFVPVREGPADAPQLSVGERLAGMFYEPARVFESLRARPHWLAPVLVMAVVSFAYSQAFTRRLTPERIISFTMDKVAESGFLPAERVEEAKAQQIAAAKSPVAIFADACGKFTAVFFFAALVGALYMLAVMMFGARIGFWRAFAVAAHAWMPPIVLGKLLSLVILFVKDPDSVHPILGQESLVTDNLGALVSTAQHPVLFALATSIGVLALYRVWLVATGLRHTSEKLGKSSAWVIAIIFWALGIIIAVSSAALFGNFMS